MARKTTGGRGAPALSSPVSSALLGLVIEDAGDGREFLRRFKQAYAETLELNSPSQLNAALDSLASKGLIEELSTPAAELSPGHRTDKPRYRATPKGVRAYQDSLIAQAKDERRRSRLFALQVAALTPAAALKVIETYELACLKQVKQTPRADAQNVTDGDRYALAARLAREEDRLAIGARLTWIEYARRELRALIQERALCQETGPRPVPNPPA